MHLTALLKKIESLSTHYGRQPHSVKLLAVSKKQSVALMKQAIALGQRRFGESYLQEALDKMAALSDYDLEWHFIGAIQSNKTKPIAQHFDWVHSVDRLKIAERLNEHRPPNAKPLNVLIQVNISHEASKAGIHENELIALTQAIQGLPHLCLRGLMAFPAKTDDFDEQRVAFAKVKTLLDACNQQGLNLDTLSMGTSNDFEAAIAEGATLVRLGTTLFGERKP